MLNPLTLDELIGTEEYEKPAQAENCQRFPKLEMVTTFVNQPESATCHPKWVYSYASIHACTL
jgi:hypothetical protein